MMTIEEFADPKRHSFSTLESKMAHAYRETIEELESAYRDYWRTMRVDQVEDLTVPYFLPDYEKPLQRIDELETRLSVIQTDIEDFVSIVCGYSRREIAEELYRCELEIAKAKRQARRTLKKAVEENPRLSLDEVEKLETVQAVFSKRDRIIAKLRLIMAEMEDGLKTADEILNKYV